MPRTIKRAYRDRLHPVLVQDCANTAVALGDALMGGAVSTGRMLRERLTAELLLLDALAWAPTVGRDLFELDLPDEQLALAAQRLHRVGVELVAEYNETALDRRTAQLEADRETGIKTVLLASYLLRDVPLELLDATSEPVQEVCR